MEVKRSIERSSKMKYYLGSSYIYVLWLWLYMSRSHDDFGV